MHVNFSQSIGLGVVVAATLCLGGIATLATEFSQPNKPVWGGHYQSSVEEDFIDHFPVSDWSRDLWNAFQLVVLDQTHSEVIHTKDDWLFTAEEFRQPTSVITFSDELTSVAAELRSADVELLTIVVPDKARIYSEKLPHTRLESLELRYDEVLRQLAAAEVTALDLRPVLVDLKPIAAPYLRTDTHWSPLGADAVAQSVANLVAPTWDTSTTFETTWSDPSPFDGDLLAFVETGLFGDLAGFAEESVPLASTEQVGGEMSLFGDVDIPVTLVGTSFSANPSFNFDGFLRQHLDADVLNAAQIGRGPFEPMRDYLASDEFKSTPPKLIIWEIPERYISTKDIDR